MPKVRTTSLSRRGLLAAGGAVGLGAVLAACGDEKKGSGSGSGSSSEKSGPWTFKDDRGLTAKAKSTPKNIVAFTGVAAALHDYGIEVKGVFGPTKTKDGKADVQAGDLDISKVEILGNVWGEFNVEKYAALGPELLVTAMWEKDALWYVPDESKDKILKLAPSVALWAAQTTIPKAIQRHEDLAASLGADVKAAKITAAKARFEKAAARLRAAAKSKPNIKVMIGSASQDLFYVSLAKTSADTLYFQELGVKFVEPKVNAAGFFEELSWENVDKYDADIIMMDNRSSALQPDALTSKPTWAQLPAVKAGQVIPRTTEPIYSYDKCAPILEDLAKAIEDAKKAG
ncbi:MULTISPECIES: ABC transporter substrate-binding protein [unclassified Streptomyces]|uniref:ABC transporter substrate-binding protein n=1 Tax=unclassified Streptomyces TaxID=2593676 RepID=UPI002DD93B9E|nr:MULTISPECIES: ABC transporter substrate-binding protein [unclassified Streptomyces]WSF86616.1 ABC transporter substrate-binding protein [Streptomyces sp. NBC_01744]WSC37114.1 ABC transporter substrate-binding protein [Streptomyces sp. NBC_01763]WSC45245.1 ABC transporter substrate-binding protein [Streptomyces sp. NBC_01762]WSC55769.1 ABC transporter substrate-binding protein [Streptomyces sp. NBC_01761]WSD24906.1 ABC transporter substrate-binding protein [Streptomyces sp. NBC_01751]